MPAPDSVTINPAESTDFSVVDESPHKFVYKFWIRRPGEPWQLIGPELTDDERSDHWIFLPRCRRAASSPIGSASSAAS